MGFQSVQSTHRAKLYAPFYGLSTLEVATEEMLLSLNRSMVTPMTTVLDFTLDAPTGSNLYMYFASPVSLGLVQFLDVESTFVGGWDGANNDPFNVYGPITMNITAPDGSIIPFYVYRTDWYDLGSVRWQSSPEPV